MRTDDLALAFEVKPGQVAAQDEKKDEGQQKDDELERPEQQAGNLGGAEFSGPADEIIDDEEQDDQDGDDDGQDARALLLGRQDVRGFRHARALSEPPGRRPVCPGNRPVSPA